jgi:hypothetical protein
MDGGGKKMTLCWGQAETCNMEPQISQGPWPLRATALSCYWKLWLEALEKWFNGDKGQAWNVFTAKAMASIPEDVRDDRDILSMMNCMALTDIIPPDRCYPNALLTAFNSQLAFGDTKISFDEVTRRAITLKAIAAAQ